MPAYTQFQARSTYRTNAFLSATLLASAILCSPALADDRNQVIAQKLYSKLETALSASDPASPNRADALVLAMPGYVLEKQNFNYNDPNDIAKLNSLIDQSLSPSWRLRLSPDSSTSSIYNNIIGNHVIPSISLSTAEEAQLKKAQALIYADATRRKYSPTYNNFDKTRTDYYSSLDNLQSWQTLNPHKTAPAKLTNNVQRAQAAWNLLGRRQEIYAALSIIETFENRNPATYWGSLSAKFNDNQAALGAGTYPIYNFLPSYPSWMDQSLSWTKVSLNDADTTTIQTSSHVSWGGSASASWGLFSVGGGYGETTDRTSLSIDGTNFSVAFEVLRVNIQRPWMDAGVFGSRTWAWSPGSTYDRRTISDGPNADGSAPTGVAPILAVELLLARNISLTGNWNTDLSTTYHNQKNGGGHFGWGPFSFGGNYNSSYDEKTDHTQISGNTITSQDVQIIGLLVHILPRTPDPDRINYTWPATNAGPAQPVTASMTVGPFTVSGAATASYNARLDSDAKAGKRAEALLAGHKQ